VELETSRGPVLSAGFCSRDREVSAVTVPTHDERTVYGTDPDPGEITSTNVPMPGGDDEEGESP